MGNARRMRARRLRRVGRMACLGALLLLSGCLTTLVWDGDDEPDSAGEVVAKILLTPLTVVYDAGTLPFQGILWGVLAYLEDDFIYHPRVDLLPTPAAEVSDGGEWVQVEDVALDTADGVRLHAWHARPRHREGGQDAASPVSHTLLWLHGNAGNLRGRYDLLIEVARRVGVEVLIVDYRGYGRSDGEPDEEGLYLDARAAWDHLVEVCGVRPEQIVVLGVSLGGGVASHLATEVEPGGLILQSTFTSMPDQAHALLPWVPRFWVGTGMPSLERLPAVRCPVLVVHGDADRTIPFTMGERLFAAAPEPKRFLRVPHGGHNDVVRVAGVSYVRALREFLELCAERASR